MWGNTALTGSHSSFEGCTPHDYIIYSLVQEGHSGTGNLDADPLFVDHTNGDLRLKSDSPAINAAYNEAAPAGVTTAWTEACVSWISKAWGSLQSISALTKTERSSTSGYSRVPGFPAHDAQVSRKGVSKT
jgi:hypothetical protein